METIAAVTVQAPCIMTDISFSLAFIAFIENVLGIGCPFREPARSVVRRLME
jgi:hypothetical protein